MFKKHVARLLAHILTKWGYVVLIPTSYKTVAYDFNGVKYRCEKDND